MLAEKHVEQAYRLVKLRAENETQDSEHPYPYTPADLWDAVSEYDIYQSVMGDKFPIYSTDEDTEDRYALADSFQDGYYDVYDSYAVKAKMIQAEEH